MDYLVENKESKTQSIMTEQVFALNGGEALYSVLDNSDSDTFAERTNPTKTETKADAGTTEQRIANAAIAAKVYVGNSSVVANAGKPGAVVVAEVEGQQPMVITDLNSINITSDVPDGTPVNLKTMSMSDLNAVDSVTGNTQMIGDGSVEAKQAMLDAEGQKMLTQVPSTEALSKLNNTDLTGRETNDEGELKDAPETEKKK